jgi:RNA polymerase sigma-70 factor (ECF subfamily)
VGDPGSAERFTVLFDELSPRIYAYARRHCDPAAAQDVVADTFLVAWHKRDQLPDEPLPWLLVVARNTLANHRRRLRRHDRLVDAMQRLEHLAGPVAGPDAGFIERDTLLAGLAELSEAEREALLLVAWDGLRNADAARVAGCSQRAFEVRLSRARARLARSTAHRGATAGSTDAKPSTRERISYEH